MTQPGPSLERLIRRLTECPGELLGEPLIGQGDGIRVDAVVNDLAIDLGIDPLSHADTSRYRPKTLADRNLARLRLICCWLFDDPWFRGKGDIAFRILDFLLKELRELADIVAADLFVSDADRREELARHCLQAVRLRPMGETEHQASDRLKAISSVERARVVRETRVQQERARQLREKMRQKRAREAAAKANREW